MHAICLHNMKYYWQLNCGSKLSDYFNGAFLNFRSSWNQFPLKLVDKKIIKFSSHYFWYSYSAGTCHALWSWIWFRMAIQNGRVLAFFVKLMKNSSWSLTNNFKSVFYIYHSIWSTGSSVKILSVDIFTRTSFFAFEYDFFHTA